MRKAMAKHGLRLFTAVFVLLGALTFSATETQAQGADLQLMAQSQTYNWLTEAEAMLALNTQLIIKTNKLSTLTPGTPAYNDVKNQLVFYKLIYAGIEGGTSTMDATNNNLFKVPNENGSVDNSPIPVNFEQLYINAIGLLTN